MLSMSFVLDTNEMFIRANYFSRIGSDKLHSLFALILSFRMKSSSNQPCQIIAKNIFLN